MKTKIKQWFFRFFKIKHICFFVGKNWFEKCQTPGWWGIWHSAFCKRCGKMAYPPKLMDVTMNPTFHHLIYKRPCKK